MTRPDLDSWMERQRDELDSVDTCVRCGTPLGALARVTIDLAAYLGCDDRALLCAGCRRDATAEMERELTAFLDEGEPAPAPTLPPCADVTTLVAIEARLRAEAVRAGWTRDGYDVIALVRPRAACEGCHADYIASVSRWEMRDGVRVRRSTHVQAPGSTPEAAAEAVVLFLRVTK